MRPRFPSLAEQARLAALAIVALALVVALVGCATPTAPATRCYPLSCPQDSVPHVAPIVR